MEQLQHHSEQTISHVHTILKLEAAPPFTQNTHYLADKRDSQVAKYKAARPRGSKPLENESTVSEALGLLARLGFIVKGEDLGKLNPPDEFEEELEIMAEVRAYFQVSYKVRLLLAVGPEFFNI